MAINDLGPDPVRLWRLRLGEHFETCLTHRAGTVLDRLEGCAGVQVQIQSLRGGGMQIDQLAADVLVLPVKGGR